MTTLTPPGMITVDSLESLDGMHHAFFTREGGFSDGLFASLNCGFKSGDDRDKVQANRDKAVAQFGLPPERLASVTQIHSSKVVLVDADWPPAEPIEADAMVTKRRGMALGVLGADCAPVLFADPDAGIIGAAHAGWRGALHGVLDETVAAMRRLGARPERMTTAIGPCIAQESYEVGPEFPAAFLAQEASNANFFAPSPRFGHHRFDLPGYIARRLERLSVAIISRTKYDTAGREDLFFSYRRARLRGEAANGLLLSAIMIEE